MNQCTCLGNNAYERYHVNMSCLRVKLFIDLIQLIPFIK